MLINISQVNLVNQYKILEHKTKPKFESRGKTKSRSNTRSKGQSHYLSNLNATPSPISLNQNLEKNKLKKRFYKSKHIAGESFIEKSAESSEISEEVTDSEQQDQESESTTKPPFFSIDSLAERFSVNELKKIKSLIQFAKNNKILDKIYEKAGKVKMEAIYSPNSEIAKLKVKFLFQLNKKIVQEQQEKITQKNLKAQGKEVAMQNLMNFIQDQNVKFKQSINKIENTLSSLNEKLLNATSKVENLNSDFDNENHKLAFSFRQINPSSTNSNMKIVSEMMQNSASRFLEEYSNQFLSKIQNLSSNF